MKLTINNDCWSINSALNATNVAVISKKYQKNLKLLPNTWTISFDNCKHIDSAGLALIIQYIKYAKQQSIKLKLEGINEKALNLAQVQGVREIIEEYL